MALLMYRLALNCVSKIHKNAIGYETEVGRFESGFANQNPDTTVGLLLSDLHLV